MKSLRLCLLILAAIGLAPTAATAIGYLENADGNSIGFYFEECGWCNEMQLAPTQMITGYVVLAQPTEAELEGYVFGLDYTGPVIEASVDLYGASAANIALEVGAYNVQLSEPMLTTDATILAEVTLFVTGSDTAEIYGRGLPAGDDCQLGYRTAGGFVPCIWPICGIIMPGDTCLEEICHSAHPLAVINGAAPVATDQTNWSTIKAMYSGS